MNLKLNDFDLLEIPYTVDIVFTKKVQKRQFLNSILKEADSDIVIDGVLYRFEFTFELAWKTIKDYMEYLGITEKVGSPREIIQNGYKQGTIKDGEKWIKRMLSRNTLSHIYDEKTSREIYENIKNEYIQLFDELKENLDNIVI